MTSGIDRVIVPADLDGVRADKAVATLVGIPRTRAHDLIDAGLVTVDGVPTSPSSRLKAGVELAVTRREAAGPVAATDVAYSVAYEDEHLLVVDKPAGVVVHPASGVGGEMLRSATLVSGLVHRYPDLAGLEEQRFGLVHRLDKDTSGLLLVARSSAVHGALQDMLRRRAVTRTYLALVAGEPPATRGTIDAPIGRHRATPTRMTVDAGGKAARTHYRRLAGWPGTTLLEVTLESGRTHQIRVHLAAVGLPVVGDRAYGRRRATAPPPGVGTAGTEAPRHPADPGRQWLHAVRLELTHPVYGEDLTVSSPLPVELAAALARLGGPATGRLPAGGIT
jgi:23S rRNA pseudouridine1911/1915/1917 synthase